MAVWPPKILWHYLEDMTMFPEFHCSVQCVRSDLGVFGNEGAQNICSTSLRLLCANLLMSLLALPFQVKLLLMSSTGGQHSGHSHGQQPRKQPGKQPRQQQQFKQPRQQQQFMEEYDRQICCRV